MSCATLRLVPENGRVACSDKEGEADLHPVLCLGLQRAAGEVPPGLPASWETAVSSSLVALLSSNPSLQSVNTTVFFCLTQSGVCDHYTRRLPLPFTDFPHSEWTVPVVQGPLPGARAR